MLPKQGRIRKKKEHEAIYQRGNRLSGRFIRIIYLMNGRAYNRFAFVVGLKISKKAVERNRLKRRLRAIVREQQLSWPSGYDFLFLAFPGGREQNSQALRQDIDALMRRLKVRQ